MLATVVVAVVVLSMLSVGYSYLKANPPLAAGVSASTSDRKVVLVSVGNKSKFGDIKILQVLVNGDATPAFAKIQVSDHRKGFIISSYNEVEHPDKFAFAELSAVSLGPGTEPGEQLEKLNEGTASTEEKIYALTIADEATIERITIKYRYYSMTYETTLSTEMLKQPEPVPTNPLQQT
ncbi:hypothetical protein FHS16_003385 [Paenibacillus endophyticus]|uniref:Uncharacterized protein n=1 Tax=Paenibacillus endophyticus TaxID=1294268 RepID=A0A7W5GBF8_9BACL|nr:hypothetical protein [Paenibacillus endophyticus]MBB3153323.1 hypothetical protein [Paenibacillus endophyticus]